MQENVRGLGRIHHGVERALDRVRDAYDGVFRRLLRRKALFALGATQLEWPEQRAVRFVVASIATGFTVVVVAGEEPDEFAYEIGVGLGGDRAGTHPGAGLPGVISSGKIVADLIGAAT